MGLPEPSVSSTAVVTGASSGIGAAIAKELASRGHSVTLVARREERLQSLATELAADHGVVADVIACDLGEDGERDRLATELRNHGRLVEVLVNNAGFGHQADFARSPHERMVEMVRINVEAVVDLTSRFLTPMVDQWPRQRDQHRLDRGLPAATRLGGVRSQQVVRPLFQRGDSDRAARLRSDGDGRLVPVPCGPSSPRSPASRRASRRRRPPSSGCRPTRWPATRPTARSTIAAWSSPALSTARAPWRGSTVPVPWLSP